MAGGIGSRLWPLSSPQHPKQFAQLFEGQSMLQKTLLRNASFGRPTVIVSSEYKKVALNQAEEIGIDIELILEPTSKNTAPCAVIALLLAKEQNFQYVLLLPADHYIENCEASNLSIDNDYRKEIEKALSYAPGSVVTLGIKPRFASTSFGYIETKKTIALGVHEATKFIEKPAQNLADELFKNANYFWNLGIFIYDVDFMLEQLLLIQPQLLALISRAYERAKLITENIRELPLEEYQQIQAISVDFAIMEHLNKLILIEINFAWHDLGNWHSLWLMGAKDRQNNHFTGKVLANKVTNCYVRSEKKLTALLGLDNLIVISTDDITFVADKSRAEEVKYLAYQNSSSALLVENAVSKYDEWGYYQIIEDNPSYKIKKLVIQVNAKLKLQATFNSNERWLILQGKVKVSSLRETKQLSANDQIVLGYDMVCNLTNIGQTELHLIKIQTNA